MKIRLLFKLLARVIPALICFAGVHALTCHAALVFYGEGSGGLSAVNRPGVTDPLAALAALANPPPASEPGRQLISGIPSGTAVLSFEAGQDVTRINFSQEIIGSGLDEARLALIFDQVRATFRQFGLDNSIRLETGGKLLSEYLPPVTPVQPGPAPAQMLGPLLANGTALSGKNITIGPSHGRFWNGSGWYWQRSDPCGFGEAVLEDLNSIRLMQFLYQYLAQDGALVHVPRELNESNCCNTYEGQAWWRMAAYSWLRANGLPCSVWANSTGNCGEETAVGRVNDDIRARPLFADYRGSDIYIAHHSNAAGGTGTETYRDTAMEHPAHETASYNLALAVNNNVIDAIRNMYDSTWANRGVKDANGGFGEIRIPNRPACLIELAFHDRCDKDALYLRDNFFRSVAEWGLYKGVCEYFGVTPTWDKYSDEYVSDTIPSTMNAGQSYNVSVTFRNRGVVWSEARAFRLGANGDSDPFTSVTRHVISGEVKPGNTYTFTFALKAPTAAGTYTTDWRMVRDGVAWFGPTHSEQVTVLGATAGCGTAADNNQGLTIGTYTADWQGNPTSHNFPATDTSCGYPVYYIVDRLTTSCTPRGGNATWNPGFTWSGRGYVRMDFQVPCSKATSQILVQYRNTAGAANGQTSVINECAYSTWMTPLEAETADLANWNGCFVNSDDSVGAPSGGCNTTCNVRMTGVAQMRMYGSRWNYVNDWICLGGYGSSAVADTHGFNEAGLYVYPAIDTTHGNVIAPALFSGKIPGRVMAGDCNNANTLNFKGNAAAYGNGDNMSSYGFAWAYAPAGATPKLLIGSDDGVRVWVNGNLVHDNNASRGLTRDQDETAAVPFDSGWNRILFKVRNGSSGFEGTLSLRTAGDRRLNEPGVNVFDMGGYYSYGAGFEQDSWYPCADVAAFYGNSNPQPNSDHYGNNTTVTASGSASGNGPVPFWKVMHFEWGYGTPEGNYADVTSSGTAWSHTQTGVIGHRRFHFFSVSRSGRTSFQNSGLSGGSNWADGGAANYMDVFVDNVPPQDASFTSATPTSPTQISLQWATPLDHGVGITAGATEAADEASSTSASYYRRGDVGCRIYRNGTAISAWGAGTSFADSGLTPNSSYTYTVEARDNSGQTRGAWANYTGQKGSTIAWTLSLPPTTSSIVPNSPAVCIGASITWTAADGFGPGGVSKYKYAWNQSASYAWSGSELEWSSASLETLPTELGTWYLHVKGHNGANVENGAFAYSVNVSPPPFAPSVTYNCGEATTLKIKISNLTTNTVQSVGTPARGTSSKDDTFMYYTPSQDNTNNDSFTYVVTSDASCTQQGLINIIIIPVTGEVQIPDVPASGPVVVKFEGVPGYSYIIERATSLGFTNSLRTWPTNAPDMGSFEVQDDFADLGLRPTAAYYRLRYIP